MRQTPFIRIALVITTFLTLAVFIACEEKTPYEKERERERKRLLAKEKETLKAFLAETNDTADAADSVEEKGIPIRSLAVSPTGTHVALGAADGTVGIWDVTTNAIVITHTLSTQSNRITALAWGTRTNLLACGTEKGNVIFFTTNGIVITNRALHTNKVAALLFNDDASTLLTASYDGRICRLATNGRLLTTYAERTHPVTSLVYNSNASRFVSGELMNGAETAQITVWNTHPQRRRVTVQRRKKYVMTTIEATLFDISGVNAVAWSPSGAYIAWGMEQSKISLYRMEGEGEGETLFPLEGHTLAVSSLAFATNSDRTLLASAGYDGKVMIWDIEHRTLVAECSNRNNAVYAIAWHPKGDAVFAVSEDGRARLWRTNGTLSNVVTYTHPALPEGVTNARAPETNGAVSNVFPLTGTSKNRNSQREERFFSCVFARKGTFHESY